MAKKAAKKSAKKVAKKVAKKKTKKAAKKAAKKTAAKEEEAATPEVAAPPTEINKDKVGTAVAEGDFIYVDILGRIQGGKIFQVTNEDRAKKEKLWDDKSSYGPELVKVGERGFLMEGVTEELKKDRKVGDTFTVDLPPEQAFGKRDAKKLRMMSIREFKKKVGQNPQPGLSFTDPRTREEGVVTRVSQGRVRLDLNHPLAGKEVSYEVTVLDKLDSEEEIINAFMTRRARGIDPSQFKIDHDKDEKVMTIEVPQAYMFNQQIIYYKFGLAMDLQQHVDSVETVKFVEIFKKNPVPGEHDHEHDHEAEEEGASEGETDGE